MPTLPPFFRQIALRFDLQNRARDTKGFERLLALESCPSVFSFSFVSDLMAWTLFARIFLSLAWGIHSPDDDDSAPFRVRYSDTRDSLFHFFLGEGH